MCLLRPKSRGDVTLNSSDPFDDPKIDPKFLSDPDDMKDMMKAYDRYNSKVMKKDKVKMYDDLPDIRQRFRGAPGPQRKITRGMKNYMRRAEALQKDRLKRLGPIRGDKK